MCLQLLVCHGTVLQITDFKNAFCQSHRLNRPLGPILAQPCKGLPSKSGELIQLLRPVHGLDGPPIERHETITTEFVCRVSVIVVLCWSPAGFRNTMMTHICWASSCLGR